MPVVGVSPGSTKMSSSLKRNCHILVSGVMGVILENLGVSGGGGPGPANCGAEPRDTKMSNSLKRTCHILVGGMLK